MDINQESADRLCKQLLEGIVRWPAVDAALQTGGFEDKARGRFEKAIVRWLETDHPNEHFIVLPEYARSEKAQRGKSIDFSLIQPEPSTAAPTRYLSVKALFEVKFNYATQTGQKKADGGEFRRRLTANAKRDAIQQTQSYKTCVCADNAYLLYLIAAPAIAMSLPQKPRDSGWEHFDYLGRPDDREAKGMEAARSEITIRLAMRQPLEIRGEYEIAARSASNPRDCSFYCCVIEV
jgi:hypothetical protein